MSSHKTTTAERITKAKVALLLDHPFFGTLVTRLDFIEDRKVGTMATNGKVLRWDPRFVDELSDAELKGVLAHETLHVANGHTWRRGGRDAGQWNVACDKAINSILKRSGFVLPTKGCFADANEEGKSAETIFSMMRAKDQQQEQDAKADDGDEQGAAGGGEGEEGEEAGDEAEGGNGGKDGQGDGAVSDPGGCGAVEDAPNGDEGAKEQEADWKVAVAQAATAAKSQGKLPGDMQRLVDEIVNPKVPWSVLLRDFVERTARNDYNWSYPNRRHLGRGIILPSLVSEELPEIVIAIDTSGSIGAEQLNLFAAEVSAVLGAYETTIQVIFADARVCKVETVTRADLPLKLTPAGGGGTDFRPVFHYVQKEGMTPAALIYLTDGFGSFPGEAPDYPVLWVMTSDQKAPFGETVELL